jgi:hypothetical protein
MWSLPDINRFNRRAAEQATQNLADAAQGPPAGQQCECYGCDNHAVCSEPWYDIFSDDPKGLVHTCDEHDGSQVPDTFRCETCNRLMADHYTWERYQDSEGDCLTCAAQKYFADDDNWIDPAGVKRVVLKPYDPRRNGGNAPLFNPKTGVLNIARCKHVLGVKQPVPDGIEFVDNAEFDNCDGHQISGDDVLDIIHRLPAGEKFCPVLDAAYQFAVSIGIYVRNSVEKQRGAA